MALIDKKSLYDLVPNDGPVSEMDALQGPQFANPVQYSPSLHENSLEGLYDSSVHNTLYGPSTLDIDGNPGPQFANGEASEGIHEGALEGVYNSSVHNKEYAMSLYDMDGNPGPGFANTQESTLHVDALAGTYNSSVHNRQYSMTLYDLDGNINPDTKYLSNLPEGLSALPG